MHLKHGAALQGGKYRIEKLLGQGGFGITYLAVQTGLNRKVAIKEFFMKEHCNRDADTSRVSVPSVGSRELVAKFKDKFIREAQMIYDLKHQNIILIRDFFEENGTAYYVMEYHDGGSLGSLPLPLTAEEASVYIRQVASALSYLHDRNTMHLDVKPSNVLIDKEGNAVLIDFGISKHYDYDGHQTSSTPVGISKGYAPIEQYSQSTLEFNPATDIYSLGATLYKLLTGDTPPEASLLVSNPKLLIFPSSVSEPMAALIRRCMSPSLDARPQSISEFLGLLDDALAASTGDETKVDSEDDATTVIFGNDKVDVDSGDKTPTPSEKKKSRRWLWWLVALLAAITCATAVLFMGKDAQSAGSSETPSSQTEADQAKSDAQQYASLMEKGTEYEDKDEYLEQAREKYSSAKELEEKWSQSKDYGSLFSQDAAGALKRVENKLKELEKAESRKKAAEKQFNEDLSKYNQLISDADKLYDKGDESSLKTAIEKYKSASEIESVYKGSVYSDRFNRNASASAGRAEKRLSDVQAAQKRAKEQAAAKKKAEEATKKKAAAKSVSLTGSHNGYPWVDLGLSVKWATCNVGASNPGEYGNFYAWGETSAKGDYSWSTYKWYDNFTSTYTKYNADDKKKKLDVSDDAATANWGGDWRLPTETEFEELLDNCTWEWTTLHGHNGCKVTSKKNGQSIFLPAAGCRRGADEFSDGSHGNYWSSTHYGYGSNTRILACDLHFRDDYHSVSWSYRYDGYSVRPVLE